MIDHTYHNQKQHTMGTIYQGLPSLLPDLKVTVHKSSLVFPSQETEKRTLFLSNIDQVLNFDVETVHFFESHKDFSPKIVADKLKDTLAKILVPYDFYAGRLKLNSETSRLEIDCNAAGAGFVVASSEYTLDEIGDLVYPNPAFAQLVCKTSNFLKPDDQPLCIFQLTSFKCGGFAIGISTNHATLDGLSFKLFLDNLAALGHNKPLAVTLNHDRHLLAARSPPHVSFPHPELGQLKIPNGLDSNSHVFEASKEDLAFNIFRLTSDKINSLKEKAKAASGVHPNARITSFNVVTAHIWRCKALSCDTGINMDRMSTILYAVDIRPRLNPPLPPSYAGNAVLTAYATATCKELNEGPFARLVEMVSEGARRMTDEYARSVIDWGEFYKGFPNGEFLVSSWWRLGFDEVDYPWGRPRYSCPVVYQRKDIILLFPDIKKGGGSKSGVSVLVALPGNEMEKFQSLFHKFLA